MSITSPMMELIRKHEGLRLEPYKCTAEKTTIGRLKASSSENCFSLYNPVGYALKYNRDSKQKIVDIRKNNLERRCHILQDALAKRVI